MTNDSTDQRPDGGPARKLTVELDAFGWEAVSGLASEMNVSVEELGVFALLYYVADRDSGRLARRLPPRIATDAKRVVRESRAR